MSNRGTGFGPRKTTRGLFSSVQLKYEDCFGRQHTRREAMNEPDIGIWWAKRLLVIALLSTAAYGQRYGAARTGMQGPPSNPLTPAKVALGKRLFFETRLSADERLSCSTCHDPAHAFSDTRGLSVGVLGRRGKRHTPTLLGRSLGESQFWDGRAATLEEQVLQPILNPDEMGMTLETVLQRLNQDRAYRGLTRESLAGALASYLRTVRSENSSFDRFLSGRPGALSDLELEGLRLFRDKARCYICHSGTRLTDEAFHNTGVAWRDGALQDEGRAAITGKLYHKGAFKTPTLREVGRRGPYMHDGSLATLEDVIDFYDRGGNQNPCLDENIVPLHLSEAEKKALLAFLRTGLAGYILDGMIEK
jgi:cytochrome c peroxidase